MGRWEELEHTADLALHLWGVDLADLFATAARGMFALLVDLEHIPLTEERWFALQAEDVEILLVDWLNELLYWGEREELAAYKEFDFVELTPTSLQVRVRGGPATEYHGYIKAATFHNLEVRATEKGYETEIVFDT
ncbi:MAG TPA: archease [Thermoflexia bacterium]|nr:archease [Thermoflexia bacterium]